MGHTEIYSHLVITQTKLDAMMWSHEFRIGRYAIRPFIYAGSLSYDWVHTEILQKWWQTLFPPILLAQTQKKIGLNENIWLLAAAENGLLCICSSFENARCTHYGTKIEYLLLLLLSRISDLSLELFTLGAGTFINRNFQRWKKSNKCSYASHKHTLSLMDLY